MNLSSHLYVNTVWCIFDLCWYDTVLLLAVFDNNVK